MLLHLFGFPFFFSFLGFPSHHITSSGNCRSAAFLFVLGRRTSEVVNEDAGDVAGTSGSDFGWGHLFVSK